MRSLRSWGIWAGLALLQAGSARFGQCAQYYVDNGNASASDANAGTALSAPWKTIQKAASTMVAGDTAHIAAGTYNETVTMQNSGTAANRITYRNYNNGKVVIPKAFTVSKNYIVVQGLEIAGDSLNTEGSYCQILDNYIHNAGTFGLFLHGSYHLVRGNKIANNGASWGGQITTGWGTGHHIVLEYNDVSDAEGRGEDLMQYLNHDFIVRGNSFHHLGDNGRHNDCYQSGGGEYNIWFLGNSFTSLNNVQYFMVGPSGDRDHVWRNNLFWGSIGWGFNGAPAGMRIVNNTFGTALGGYGIRGGGISRNNIYHDWGTQTPYDADSADYNLIKPLPTWGVTRQPHDLWGVDPQFVNFAGRDFHLRAASPCIDAGCFLTTTSAAGSGTQLPVSDARYFVDGFGIADGDWIQLQGQKQTAQIRSIDYAANVITLDRALTWSNGQGVSMPYRGSAPDLGAYEYSNSRQKGFDGNGDGKADILLRHSSNGQVSLWLMDAQPLSNSPIMGGGL